MYLHPLYACVIAALISLSSVGYGLFGFRPFQREMARLSACLRLALAFGAGTGMLSMMTFGIGLAGWLSRPVVAAMLLGGLLLNGRAFARLFHENFREYQRFTGRLGRYSICLWLIGLLAGLNMLAALAPPLDNDALNYHLAAPHLYAIHQRILPLPSIYHSFFPFNIQMLYALSMVCGSASAPQCLHALFGMMNTLTVGLLARRIYGVRTAALAMLFFYALPDVSAETPLARVDLGVSAYALLAFVSALDIQPQKPLWQWSVISAGIFGGLCAGSKYTGLIVPCLIAMLLLAFFQGSWRSRLNVAVIAAGIACLIASPWYLRNLVWTGNPTFPFLTGVFGETVYSSADFQRMRQGNWEYAALPRTALNFLRTPWLLLTQRDAFSSNRLSPLFLTYLPLLFIFRWRRLRPVFPWLFFCALWSLFWFWTSPLLRFFFAPLGMLSIFLASAVRLTFRYNRRFRWISVTLVSFWLTFAIAWNMKYHIPLARVALGFQPFTHYLRQVEHIDGYRHDDFDYVNNRLQPQRLLLFDAHGVYIQQRIVLAADWASKYRQEVMPCETRRISAALSASGVTHVMWREGVQARSVEEDALLQCVRQRVDTRLIYTLGMTRVIALENWTAPVKNK